ncbi:MAG: hypothetical protein GY714_09680 [Desulfobacterales bacterium]|nr:hypothetical protein [Desulfobacterales bacterium]
MSKKNCETVISIHECTIEKDEHLEKCSLCSLHKWHPVNVHEKEHECICLASMFIGKKLEMAKDDDSPGTCYFKDDDLKTIWPYFEIDK